jgi:hypothetical protein
MKLRLRNFREPIVAGEERKGARVDIASGLVFPRCFESRKHDGGYLTLTVAAIDRKSRGVPYCTVSDRDR